MTEKAKEKLLENLDETHLGLKKTLKQTDLEIIVYEASGWRVRDIIGHIATWDQEVTRSINAYNKGSEYSIPDLDEAEVDYNERAVKQQQKLSSQQILDEWEQAYIEFRRAVREMPVDLFSGDMLYPWGSERGSVSRLVAYMLEHVEEHQNEILKALQA